MKFERLNPYLFIYVNLKIFISTSVISKLLSYKLVPLLCLWSQICSQSLSVGVNQLKFCHRCNSTKTTMGKLTIIESNNIKFQHLFMYQFGLISILLDILPPPHVACKVPPQEPPRLILLFPSCETEVQGIFKSLYIAKPETLKFCLLRAGTWLML